LKVLFQKRIDPGQVLEAAALHRLDDPAGTATYIENGGVEFQQPGFHPVKGVGQEEGEQGANRIELVQVVAQQTFFQKIDQWIQAQPKFWLAEGVIFSGIIFGEVFRRFNDLQGIATGTFEVIEWIAHVQQPFSSVVNPVVVEISTDFTGNAGAHR
jgi:hypothetical protein